MQRQCRKSAKPPFYRIFSSLLLSFFLLSCAQSSDSKTSASGAISPQGNVALAIPKTLQKIDLSRLEGEIEVTDIDIFPLEIDLDGSGACGAIGACGMLSNLPAGIHTFTIRYFLFDLNDRRILVARASTSLEIEIGSTTPIIFPALIKPDTDGDGFDNLKEVELGFDPEDSNSFPVDPASFPILESEPNNTVANAQVITIPTIITGTAKESDPGSQAFLPNGTEVNIEDVYTFTLNSTAVVQIILNTESSGNFDLYLHSVRDNVVIKISTNPGDVDDVLETPLFPGQYNILVDAVAVISDEVYTLAVSKDPVILESEPNESDADAQPLTLPSVSKGKAVAGDPSVNLVAFGDPIIIEDQYTFTLNVPTNVFISLASTDRLADFDLYLGERDTSQIILRSANANNNPEFISTAVQLPVPLSAGQYDIYVDAMDALNDENYTLTLSIQE